MSIVFNIEKKTHMNEAQTSKILKDMHTCMGKMLTEDFGIKENPLFVCPIKPTMKGCILMKTRKDNKREKINKDLKKTQQLLLKIYKEINEIRHYTYDYLMTKKRARENENDDKIKKKRKRETATADMERRTEANKCASAPVSMFDLLEEKAEN